MPDGFSLPSFAKINWSLRILGKRADGFHDLCTLLQTVTLHDTLHFTRSEKVELTCDDPAMPVDGQNLIVRVAERFREQLGISEGASIRLEKRIPWPGGLGGGSSNAVTALIGLARLWKLDPPPDLFAVAAEVGSDTPFFLYGGTALATGRGEILESRPDMNVDSLLIVTPAVHVSTPGAFALLAAPTLTSEASERTLTVCRNEAESLDPQHSVLINDFEPAIFAAHPEIKRVKDTLLDLGAVNAAMSGSGASVYAVFDNKETRQAAQKALDLEITWRKFAVSTISRSEYAKALGI